MTIRIGSQAATTPATSSGCGKVLGTLFFGVFLFMGLAFTVVLGVETLRDLATYRWQQTPCEILAAEVVRDGGSENPYQVKVLYRYEVQGITYKGSRLTRTDASESSYSDAREETDRYPVGSSARCYVNPDRPDEAILRHSPPWIGLLVVLPLIFVAVGAGGIYATWRTPGDRSRVPISDRARATKVGPAAMIGLGLVFSMVGGVLFVLIGVLPALRLFDARAWQATPCRVITSDVRSHSSDDGTTYSVDILYEYEVAGSTFSSDRYDFTSWSSSGYSGKKAIVDRYPEGSWATCFVDPEEPSHAVLDRDIHAGYLVGLFPLLFLFAGVLVLGVGISQRRKREAVIAGMVEPSADGAPRELRASQPPLVKLLGSLLFCLFWNGIVSVFVYHLVDEWRHGNHQWFLAVFLTPFVLVGLAAVGAVIYTLLALANPRPRLRLTPSSPRLGDSIHLEWQMHGASRRIQKLTIRLEGREEATYRRGTDTATETEIFARIHLAGSDNEMLISQGAADALIPEDTMHSFAGSSNKIIWAISVHGDIARWPDINERFEITVRPRAAGDLGR